MNDGIMDQRSKILAGLFGAAMGYALLAGVVYPRWIRPLLTIDERIAERQKELDRLLAEDEAVQKARFDYKTLAGRIGSFDAARVETDIRDRLNKLIGRHQLVDSGVTPSRPVEDRKSGLTTSTITVSATGTLETAVAFMKDIAELPDLIRVGNASLSPEGGGRRGMEKNQRVNLRVPLEVWVLPQQPVVGRLDESELPHPGSVVRHAGRDYARIAGGKPFWDYVPPVPLRATIARPINVEKGTPATLEGGASGGDGEYTVLWSPSDGLSDPSNLRPLVDTSAPGNKTYTLTVTDGTGNSVTASTTVVVREPKPAEPVVIAQPAREPPPPPGPKPWPDGKNKEIRMALLRTLGDEQLDEFMIYDNKSRQVNYYKVGDEFDGGELVYVHQLGGVVKRAEEYFVYPLGMTLDRHLNAATAMEYPELQNAAARIRQNRTQPAPTVKPASPSAEGPAVAPGRDGELMKPTAEQDGSGPEEASGTHQKGAEGVPTEVGADAAMPPSAAAGPQPAAGEQPTAATEPATDAPKTPPSPSRRRPTVKPGVRKHP